LHRFFSQIVVYAVYSSLKVFDKSLFSNSADFLSTKRFFDNNTILIR
jgi:hypothetical protein